MIYAYTKVSTPYTIIQMVLPYEMDGENQCTELCTLDVSLMFQCLIL